jgi:hypothetical protein
VPACDVTKEAMMSFSLVVVVSFMASALLLGWSYFRRYQITRPPLGVLNLRDVGLMVGAIVVVPHLYLALPLWLAGGLLAASFLSVFHVMGEPVLRPRWALWPAVLLLLASDVGTAHLFGARSALFSAVNDGVLMIAVVGMSNLWAQSGMKARDVAVLAGVLALYDLIATSILPVTTNLVSHLAGIPFAPVVSWSTGHGRLGIGLGDLLLATVFPLVMRKAFGRAAGLGALAIALGTLGALLTLPALLGMRVTLPALLGMRVTLPAMTPLGPLMVLQYVYWVRQRGPERTTRQYLQAEPLRNAAPAPHLTPSGGTLTQQA